MATGIIPGSRYQPESPPSPSDLTFQVQLVEYLKREYGRIADALKGSNVYNFEEQFVSLPKPQEGDFLYADGTSWNPGDGQGFYMRINGAWVRVNDISNGGTITGDLTLQSNSAGVQGPLLVGFHNSGSPAVGDIPLEIIADGNSSAGTRRDYGAWAVVILDKTDGTEDAQQQWYNIQAGTLTQQMTLDSATGLNLPVGGIKFPASAIAFADVNTLDDYEEGTWTPTLSASTTPPTSVTYDSLTEGDYTKIGNVVFISGRVRTDAVTKGGMAGQVIIGGLPFTPGSAYGSIAIAFTNNWLVHAPTSGLMTSGSANIFLYSLLTAGGTGVTGVAVTDVGTGADANDIIFSGHYYI